MVKPDKARSVEDLVLGMARRGQLQEKVMMSGGRRQREKEGGHGRAFPPIPLLILHSHFHIPSFFTQVSEDHLVRLLDQMSAAGGGAGRTKVTIQRRRDAFDDE